MNIQEYEKLNHSVWECKYHLVFIPKYRKKALYGALRNQIGSVLRKLAESKGCQVLEGYVMTDHIHMLITIPPKYRVSDIYSFNLKTLAFNCLSSRDGKALAKIQTSRFKLHGYSWVY